MRPLVYLAALLLISCVSHAQNINFSLAEPQPDLLDVYGGSIAAGDIDGDGDSDLLISGLNPGRATALYLNDGSGGFTEVQDIPFPEASDTVSHFEDLDGDGDLDLFFSGWGFGLEEFAQIYLNDGSGLFSQQSNPDILQFRGPGAKLADVDGDGDTDLFINARVQSGNDEFFFVELYLNDGSANFSSMEMTSITPLSIAAIEFLDVDGDEDLDLFISGETEDGMVTAELYLNDGNGNFSIDTQSSFIPMHAADVDAADLDNDGDMDLLMSGTTDPFDVRTLIYLNDGSGQFTELEDSGIQNTFAGTNAIADLDNDGDEDLIIIGSQNGGLPNIYNIVYENLGDGQFLPVDTIGGEYIAACVVDDFNGNALKDVIIQGLVDDTNVYWNSTIITSLEESNALDMDIRLFPSLVYDSFRIQGEQGSYRLSLLDMKGQQLMDLGNLPDGASVDVSSLAAGMYLVRFRDPNGADIGIQRILKR